MAIEMLGLILAGGQGTRLGKLTKDVAKPAVPFGGRYRIIDFALSNCANSNVKNVGVITQYQPLTIWWDQLSISQWKNLKLLIKML